MPKYSELDLIPHLDASDFPEDVNEECCNHDIGTHYESDGVGISWDDEEDMPIMQAWLLKTYGPVVKKYRHFAIAAT